MAALGLDPSGHKIDQMLLKSMPISMLRPIWGTIRRPRFAIRAILPCSKISVWAVPLSCPRLIVSWIRGFRCSGSDCFQAAYPARAASHPPCLQLLTQWSDTSRECSSSGVIITDQSSGRVPRTPHNLSTTDPHNRRHLNTPILEGRLWIQISVGRLVCTPPPPALQILLPGLLTVIWWPQFCLTPGLVGSGRRAVAYGGHRVVGVDTCAHLPCFKTGEPRWT